MNKIFNADDAKSFRLLRPFDQKGNRKRIVTYTKGSDGTVFFPIVTNENDIFVALKNLFGEFGAIKSFYRYYFPKKFIWNSVLYNKPKYFEYIDDKAKQALVLGNLPGFRGIPRNRLMDKRNVILDQTNVMSKIFITDPKLMIRSTVINYVQDIIPETICYFLFKNNNHVELIEEDEKALESLKLEIENNTFEPKSESDLFDKYGKVDYNEFDTEEIKQKLIDSDMSEEAYKEYLYSKTKLFSLGGPIIGIDQFGFSKFIISIPITLKTHKYFSIPYLTGKINLLRQVLINPDLVYQISFLRFVTKLYEVYSGAGSSSNQFIKELLNKQIAFHFYSEKGLGFVINMDELKNNMKWDFNRFVRTFSNRLSLLVMHNLGTLDDKDLDKVEEETVNHEFEIVSNNVTSSFDTKHKLNKDIKAIVENDGILNAKAKGNRINEINETTLVVTEDDVNDDNIKNIAHKFTKTKKKTLSNNTEIIPTRNEILQTQQQANKIDEIFNRFAAAPKSRKVVIEDKNDSVPITYTDDELSDILGETSETEDITFDNETSVDIDDQIKEREDEEDNIYTNSDNPEDTLDDFTKDYGEFEDTDVVEDEEFEGEDDLDDGYTVIKPKGDKGPITLKEQVIQQKIIDPKEAKRIETLKNKYKSIEIDGKNICDIIGNSSKTELESVKISKPLETKDPKVQTKMALTTFTQSYIKNNYQADIINAVRSLSMNKEVPMYMTKVDVKDSTDQFNDKYTYTFQLEDEFKKKHTIKFDVPKLDENGLFKLNGNKCYIKKQLMRKPIVKISPDKVYITTELNSYQVMREGFLLNKGTEVVRRLFEEFFAGNPNVFVERGNSIEDNKTYLTTIEYDALAQEYYKIILNHDRDGKKKEYGQKIVLFFSQKNIRKVIKENNFSTGYPDNNIPNNILPIAINYTTKSVYSIDMNNKGSVMSTIISLIREAFPTEDDEIVAFVKKIKTPKRRMCTKIDIQSKIVPLIIFLNYLFTWDRVKSYFKESDIHFSTERIPNNNQLSIKFYDGYLYYNQYPINGALLLNGLSLVNTEDYRYEDMNNQGLYLNFLEDNFGTKNIAKGWITAKESMLDLKTLQILEALHQPTDLLEIFLYCNDLLTDNYVKSESDISNYRLRSSEIITSCLYQVLIEHYNTYKKRNGKKLALSIPQDAVLGKIYKTEIMEYYNCISPVGEIGTYNTTTFKGPGGTKEERAFTQEKRAYDESYYGTFAISTTDNHNAGVVKRLTMNPKIINTLGFIGQQDDSDISVNDVCCVEEALTPFVTKVDDPSRIAFVSIQNTHVGGINNASLPPVRTGIEKTIQYQVGEQFCRKAKKDGVITNIDINKKRVYITYKDNTTDYIEYSNEMLKNSDAYNMQTFDCFVKVGQKVKEGDLIAADNRFFKRDPITDEIIYTQARSAMVAIMEGSYTEDDSSLITETLSKNLSMNFSKCKSIVLEPSDDIISCKEIGDYVKLGDPLMIFDKTGSIDISSSIDLTNMDSKFAGFDDDALSDLIHQVPKANLDGTIEDIRVYWTVPVEQMSPSAAKFVNKYINRIKKEIVEEEKFTKRKSIKRTYIEVSKTDRNILCGEEIDNKVGGIVIQFFISNNDNMSVGDKISLHSALKSVNSTVVPKELEPYRLNGGRIDGIFSMISCNARMISSVNLSGLMGKILYDFSKQWAKDLLKELE